MGNKADMDESKRVCKINNTIFFEMDVLNRFRKHNALHLARDEFYFNKEHLHIPLLQAVPTSRGQALADEYGIKFFETVSVLLLCSAFW